MLPNIIAENREQTLGDGIVLVGRAEDLHFAAGFAGEPGPSAAELFCAGVIELGFEIGEVAKSFGDGFGYRSRRIASTLRLHDFPEHGVVDVTAAIVADGGANVIGHRDRRSTPS